MKRAFFLPALAACAIAMASCLTASAKPPLSVLEHPSPEEVEQGFRRWAEEYPGCFGYEARGVTPEGRPILMGRITEDGIPDDDKQIALLTSCHVAKELNAGTGLLRFMKWLLSDDPQAVEIRTHQIVLIVPYTDPDGIASGKLELLREIYGSPQRIWSFDGVSDPKKYPEAAALQGIMDEYRPDLYIDFHGLNYAQQTMWESTGISWASAVSRSFLHDVPRRIDEAAEAQGFLITRGEQDAGKLLTTGQIAGFPDHLFYLRNRWGTITAYPYARFHTLSFIMEVGYEESLIARTKRALQMGHERWRYERYPAYPVNQVGIWTLVSLSAWGTNATQRRESRCELWQKLPQMAYGVAGPIPCRDSLMAYVATTPKAREQVRGKDVSDVIASLREDPSFDADALAEHASRSPARSFGGSKYAAADSTEMTPIQHGMVIRLLIPYNDAELSEVRLDGHLLDESATDGYFIRRGPGTIVEIAVPPGKTKDLHIASCLYDTPTKRRAGFTAEDW
jgi:Zinc carboxypeptidase